MKIYIVGSGVVGQATGEGLRHLADITYLDVLDNTINDLVTRGRDAARATSFNRFKTVTRTTTLGRKHAFGQPLLSSWVRPQCCSFRTSRVGQRGAWACSSGY